MNSVTLNTEAKQELKSLARRNAYRMIPRQADYNSGKSPRHVKNVKMYAELTGIKNGEKHRIKSRCGNSLWTSLMFNGIPFIADTSAPANHLFFLNEENLHLCYHPECDMVFTGFKDPVNQDVEVAQVLWMGAFASSNNRMHGKFSALTA